MRPPAAGAARAKRAPNNRPGDQQDGTGIYSEQAENVTITENRFQGNDRAPITIHAASGGSDVAFTSNTITGEVGGAAFAAIDGLRVTDNTITGGSGSGIALGGDGLRDVQVLRNTITDKSGAAATGVRLTQYGNGDQNRDVQIAQNTITGITSPDTHAATACGSARWARRTR